MASEHFSFQSHIYFLSSLDEALNHLNLESNVSVLDILSIISTFCRAFSFSSILIFFSSGPFSPLPGLLVWAARVRACKGGGREDEWGVFVREEERERFIE